VVALVHHEHVGDLEDPRLEYLHRVAAARLKRDERRVGDFGDLDLGLTDADRFDQHDILTERIHQRDGVGGRAGQPAEVPARGHRANEDVGVDEVLGQPNAVAEQGAVRERRAGIDRDHADRLVLRAHVLDDRRGQRRFSDARRPGQPDGERPPRQRIQHPDELRAAAGLAARDRARKRARIAGPERSQEVVVHRAFAFTDARGDSRFRRR